MIVFFRKTLDNRFCNVVPLPMSTGRQHNYFNTLFINLKTKKNYG